MGCGTSKAAQVDEQDITIKDYPTSSSPHRHTDHDTTETPAQPIDPMDDQTSPQASDQSAIERAVHDITNSDLPARDQTNSNTSQEYDQIGPTSTDSSERVIAFEVCMSDEGSRNPKKAPPSLLARMESATKITTKQLTEQLAEKQKLAEERKQKELGKRANSKVSRKERLRKEVMAAREMDMLQQENSDRLQVEGADRVKPGHQEESKKDRLEYEPSDCFQGSYDASAEIEVDSTYNADNDQQLGMWDDNETQDQTRTKDELNLNRANLEDENSFFDDQPLTNNHGNV